jgi:signal transduction histidine kinase
MSPIPLVIRGALIAALCALAVAIGLLAEHERAATAALQDLGGPSPVVLRLVLALLLGVLLAFGYLLFLVTRRGAPPPATHSSDAAALLEAEPPAPRSDDIRPSHALLPSGEAGQMLAAGALVRRVSHELNNSLGPIQGYAELLSNDQRISEQHRRQAGRIAEATALAMRTVRDFSGALTWSNDRAAGASLGATVKAAAAAGQAALGRPIEVDLQSDSDVLITATEAEAGQAVLHLCAAVAPLMAERDVRLEIAVSSLVGAGKAGNTDGGDARRLEIWSDPFEPERRRIQFGTQQGSWRYGQLRFTVTGHGWSGDLAGRLFAGEETEASDPACLPMGVLGGMMLDLGGVITIDTCPQRHLVITLLWPTRIVSEVAAPLEIDTTEDDLDALIIHEAEPEAEALSRRLGGFGLRVASTTSPEAGLDLIAEMGMRCRAILIGETGDASLRMKVVAIRPDATVLTLHVPAGGQAEGSETWQIDPDRDALGRLAARLRRSKRLAQGG